MFILFFWKPLKSDVNCIYALFKILKSTFIQIQTYAVVLRLFILFCSQFVEGYQVFLDMGNCWDRHRHKSNPVECARSYSYEANQVGFSDNIAPQSISLPRQICHPSPFAIRTVPQSSGLLPRIPDDPEEIQHISARELGSAFFWKKYHLGAI